MTNGLGPWWFPESFRQGLTMWAARHFVSVSWEKHDAAYAAGEPARWICDRGFLRAMLGDAARADHPAAIAGLSALAWAFWLAVRLFGWLSYGRGR